MTSNLVCFVLIWSALDFCAGDVLFSLTVDRDVSNATRRRKQQPCLKAESVVGFRHARKGEGFRGGRAPSCVNFGPGHGARLVVDSTYFHCPCRRAPSLLVSSPIPCRPPLILPKASSSPLSHLPCIARSTSSLLYCACRLRRPLQPRNGRVGEGGWMGGVVKMSSCHNPVES